MTTTTKTRRNRLKRNFRIAPLICVHRPHAPVAGFESRPVATAAAIYARFRLWRQCGTLSVVEPRFNEETDRRATAAIDEPDHGQPAAPPQFQDRRLRRADGSRQDLHRAAPGAAPRPAVH